MYTFYTIPLTAAAQLVDPQELDAIIPSVKGIEERDRLRLTLLLAGLITALIWSIFFALCPVVFKVSR